MIELPRACFVADRIARIADFFSFGTNDLTQTALGLLARRRRGAHPRPLHRGRDHRPQPVRDDRQARASAGWSGSPPGSGARRKPELELGVCGEHAGDPDSIAFFDCAGVDYVSCSPYRVPIARVAAAQAAIGGQGK